jgi:hypothetical protein
VLLSLSFRPLTDKALRSVDDNHFLAPSVQLSLLSRFTGAELLFLAAVLTLTGTPDMYTH